MDEILALTNDHQPCFIFKHIFLNQLPEALQVHLAAVAFTDARDFALEADKLWCAKLASEALSPLTVNRVASLTPTSQPSHVSTSSVSSDGLCFYYAKFGSNANKCRSPCRFAGNDKADPQ